MLLVMRMIITWLGMAVFGSSSSSIWGSVLHIKFIFDAFNHFDDVHHLDREGEWPGLLDKGLHLFSNLSVVLVDEPEQELTLIMIIIMMMMMTMNDHYDDDDYDDNIRCNSNLFCKAVIHSVLYMATSSRKIPG